MNVLCLPARDEADEIVARMLAQLLEARGFCAHAPSASALASEMVEMIDGQKADVVCISAMPPATVAHARYLCKLIEARYPDLHLLVGLWTLKSDRDRARARISHTGNVRVFTTLHDAQQEIEQIVQPLVFNRTPREAPAAKDQHADATPAALPHMA